MIGNIEKLLSNEIKHPEARDSHMQVLVSSQEGWESHVMRLVTVEKDGFTPKHSHPWPHINYMVEGIGELMIEGVVTKVKSGSYAFVPSNKMH
ncbi:MAG: cupin domain-containing protein, partial [Tenericutes bacterium]|nr:cupin domain-containing protein [Mycoplasmatota bacterium]